MNVPKICVLLMAASCYQGISAQGVWNEKTPPNSPSARQGHALAYDSFRNRAVLFGGGLGSSLADTWEWDGSSWTEVTPVTGSPSARRDFAMAFDPVRNQVVLQGGWVGNSPLSDTWTWDGTTWTQQFPATSPPVLRDNRMVFDSARGNMLMFGGGFTARDVSAETWTWDGADWTQQSVTNSPPPRAAHFLACDTQQQQIVLFGGLGVGDVPLGDTWTWNGADWTEHVPGDSPSARFLGSMAYHSTREAVVLFGGADWSSPFQDTWEWNGTNWVRQPDQGSPSARIDSPSVYDSRRSTILFFGGGTVGLGGAAATFGDTWEFFTGGVALAESFGAGCFGSLSTPSLSQGAGELPRIGGPFLVEVGSLPVGILNAPFGILGFSRTQVGLIPLPFDLGLVGATGCTLYVDLHRSFSLLNENGTATWNINIPDDPGLIGRKFYLQGGVTDPGVNVLHLVVSNAVEATIGAR